MSYRRARFHARGVLSAVLCTSLAVGSDAAAAPTTDPFADDVMGFDADFRKGQSEYNSGEFLSAARTWSRAIRLLQEKPENKQNRAAVYEYIAEAYQKAVSNGAGEHVIKEALEILDDYATQFAVYYPREELPPLVAEVRAKFRAVIDVADAARTAPLKPASDPQGPDERTRAADRTWKGLTIAGGSTLAAGVMALGMFVGGLARVRAAERGFTDNVCTTEDLTGTCAELYRQGRSMDAVATAGVLLAPVLLGAGAAMLGLGLKRRASRGQLAPVFAPRMVGVTWQQSF